MHWAVVLHIAAVRCSALLVLVVIKYCAKALVVKHCLSQYPVSELKNTQ